MLVKQVRSNESSVFLSRFPAIAGAISATTKPIVRLPNTMTRRAKAVAPKRAMPQTVLRSRPDTDQPTSSTPSARTRNPTVITRWRNISFRQDEVINSRLRNGPRSIDVSRRRSVTVVAAWAIRQFWVASHKGFRLVTVSSVMVNAQIADGAKLVVL